MRQRFYNRRRHFRLASLAVVAVPQIAACPLAVGSCKVALHAGKEHIGEVVRNLSRHAGSKTSVVEVGGADSQRTDYRIMYKRGSGIAMHRKTKLERHVLSLASRHVYRPACKPVEHIRACIDVVGIVVGAVLATINRVRSARPLRTISSTFKAARHAACRSATLYVAHTAAETHSICRYNAFLRRRVGNDYTVGGAVACIEVERAEINPRSAAHLLVYAEQSALAFVYDDVLRIAYALGYSLIAHVYGVATRLLYGWLIRRPRLVAFLRCSHHACCALLERILAVAIHAAMESEATFFGSAPFLATVVLNISVLTVVVYYHLIALPVALARCVDHSAGVLEHRNEIRHNDSLCKEVFVGAEKVWTLPLPASLLLVEIDAVRLPKRNVTVEESVRHKVRLRLVHHPRRTIVVDASPSSGCATATQLCARYELLYRHTSRVDAQLIAIVRFWQSLGKTFIIIAHAFLRKVLRGKASAHIQREHTTSVVYAVRLHIRLYGVDDILCSCGEHIVLKTSIQLSRRQRLVRPCRSRKRHQSGCEHQNRQ